MHIKIKKWRFSWRLTILSYLLPFDLLNSICLYKLIDSVIAYKVMYIGPPQTHPDIIVMESVPMNQPQGPIYMGVNTQSIQPPYPQPIQPAYPQPIQPVYSQGVQPIYNYQ